MPRVSLIIPAYNSEATIFRSLATMVAQDFADCEIIVIDSSPHGQIGDDMRRHFPKIRYYHSAARLLPHAARNLGVERACGELLVFTDPDIYAATSWLSQLVAAYEQLGGVIVGAIRCYGRRWRDQGVHLAKFDAWLPGGTRRPITIAPSANVLVSRRVFDRVGGFDGSGMCGDTLISWRLAALGEPIWFAPEAVVEHDHRSSWGQLLRERLDRGQEFATLRAAERKWPPSRARLFALLTPLRLISQLGATARYALQARQGLLLLQTLPIVLTSRAAWLIGEARGYLVKEAL